MEPKWRGNRWILYSLNWIVYYPTMAPAPILDMLFGTKARTVLLRRLARELLPLSARQLAELSGLTHRAVIAALEPLVEEGIVIKRSAGPAYQYSLQREHVAVEGVLLLSLIHI